MYNVFVTKYSSFNSNRCGYRPGVMNHEALEAEGQFCSLILGNLELGLDPESTHHPDWVLYFLSR